MHAKKVTYNTYTIPKAQEIEITILGHANKTPFQKGQKTVKTTSQVWLCTPVIPALTRQWQEDQVPGHCQQFRKFKVSLDCMGP